MEVKLGYKQTEVGVIPEEWEAAHIGDVCSFSGGSQPPRSTFKFTPTPGYIRLIQIRDYKSDDFASYIPEPLARKRCTSEDIMIGRYGPPIFQILRGIEGAYNVALIKTTPTPKIEREFFFSVLNQEPLFKLIEALSRRSSGQTGVEMPALKAYGLPLPTLPEQRAIATALSDVDGLLDGLDRLIAKKRDLKQAAMQQLLTGQTRLPGFHGEWEVKRLGEVATIKDGTHQTPKYVPVGIPFFSVEHVTSGDFKNTKFISEEEHQFLTRSFKIEKGDILMTRIGSIGDCKLIDWDVNASFYVSLALLKIRSLYSAAYILHYSKSVAFQKEVALHSLQSAIPKKINLGPISNVKIELPPTIPEQTAIAEVLTEMDAELAALEQRREKTRALKQAMMQELLTGRIRLI